MSNAEGGTTEPGEVERAFVDGALRKKLGLERADLKLGLDIARSQLRRGAHMEALRTYALLVLCDPTVVDFQIGLANCAQQMGEHHLALQAASAVVALDPANPRGYFLSGSACLALGHYEEAAEDLRDAVEFSKRARTAEIAEQARTLLRKLEALKS